MKAKNIDQELGYLNAMNEIITYIKEATNFDPNKRFIDSVDLIVWITKQSNSSTEAALKTTTT